MTSLLDFAGPLSAADSGSAVVVALPATWLAAVQTLAQTASLSLSLRSVDMILRVEEPVPEHRKPLLLQAVRCGIYSQKP